MGRPSISIELDLNHKDAEVPGNVAYDL